MMRKHLLNQYDEHVRHNKIEEISKTHSKLKSSTQISLKDISDMQSEMRAIALEKNLQNDHWKILSTISKIKEKVKKSKKMFNLKNKLKMKRNENKIS